MKPTEDKEAMLTDEELQQLMKQADAIYELPGFQVTHEDTCKWAGRLAALVEDAVHTKLERLGYNRI